MSKKHKARHFTIEYVARIVKGPGSGGYLREVRGDWGPKFLSTKSLLEAKRWTSIPALTRQSSPSHVWSSDPNDLEFVPVDVLLSLSIDEDEK